MHTHTPTNHARILSKFSDHHEQFADNVVPSVQSIFTIQMNTQTYIAIALIAIHLQLTFSITAKPDEGCIVTPHTCPCSSEQASSANCITPAGKNECTLSTCTRDYTCDCKGFETCEITPCTQYEAVSQSDAGSKPTFPCEPKARIGLCIHYVGLRDAPKTLTFAAEEARTSCMNTVHSEISVARILRRVVKYKARLVDAMKTLDGFVDNVKKSDRSVFDKGVEEVNAAFKNTHAEMTRCCKSSTNAFKAAMRVSELKRWADVMSEEVLKQLEELHELEEEAVSSPGSECEACQKVTRKIERMERRHGSFVREAGKWAQTTRTHELSAKDFLGGADAQRKIAKSAYHRSLEHYKSLVAGLANETGR